MVGKGYLVLIAVFLVILVCGCGWISSVSGPKSSETPPGMEVVTETNPSLIASASVERCDTSGCLWVDQSWTQFEFEWGKIFGKNVVKASLVNQGILRVSPGYTWEYREWSLFQPKGWYLVKEK